MPVARKNERANALPDQSVEDDPWVGLHDAAAMLDESRYKILVRCQRGELETTTVAGRIFVHRASIERVLHDRKSAKASV